MKFYFLEGFVIEIEIDFLAMCFSLSLSLSRGLLEVLTKEIQTNQLDVSMVLPARLMIGL